MTGYLSDLKHKTAIKNKQDLHKLFTILHSLSGKMRQYFLRWKQENNNRKLVEELNEEGPIRELWFEQRQLLENCKLFMKDEGYNQRDIDLALKQGNEGHLTLLRKAVARM
jgi:hypothetical protein